MTSFRAGIVGIMSVAFLIGNSVSPVFARLHDSQIHGQRKHVHQSNSRHRHSRHRTKHQAAVHVQPQVGALFVTENGETLLDELSNVEFNPASVAKIVTAYGAIKVFGLDHRFSTKVFAEGEVDSSGTLQGNLYVQGIDPKFALSDAASLQNSLMQAGIKRVNAKIIVSPGFSYCCCADSLYSAKALQRAWTRGKRITILKGVACGQVPDGLSELADNQSESLRETLKEMLCYSQNSVAEQLGRVSGGVAHLEQLVSEAAGISEGSLKLSSASGLGKGRVKPRDMMLVLKSLRKELQSRGLDLQDICPVAGIDPGTLDERFTDPTECGSMVGKTGTLPGTDGGTSTLVGLFRTQKEDVYFVIFCWHGSVVGFRHQQDELIKRVQALRGGARPFAYGPLATAHDAAIERQ